MNIIEAIILGIIQGMTEFLPISSTGHLTLAGKLMHLIDDKNPEQWTAFMAVIQMGTLLAVLIYFRNDIIQIAADFLRQNIFKRRTFKEQTQNSRMGWFIIVGTLPVVIIGLLFKDFIEGTFTKNLQVIAYSLIALGVLLGIAEKTGKFRRKLTDLKWLDAVAVGLAQALALIPGSSRSGTTITAGLFLGFQRETAARFSFLLSIPAVVASGLLELYESLEFMNASSAFTLFVATVAAALSGYFAIDMLLKFLKKQNTYIFVFYRIVLGLIILSLLSMGIIGA